MIEPVSSLYTFKNFTDLTQQESDEVLHGRNDPEVRRWMTSDRVISAVSCADGKAIRTRST